MLTFTRSRKLIVALVAAGSALGIASAVQASIPDAQGVIHGCYANQQGGLTTQAYGVLRVIDTARGQACSSNESSLAWNQAGQNGPTGARGATGPKGPTGPAGSDPTVDAFVSRFGTNTNQAAAGRGAECTMGEIILTAATVANGVPANGQLLPIDQNAALFALLGTTYGGDGQTTFALPDLRGLAPNNMTYSICDSGVFPSRR